MEIKQIIGILIFVVIAGILIVRNLPIKANRRKNQQVNDKEKIG